LLTIINDILDFSKIEAGKMTLDEAPFDLEQLVEEATELLAEAAHAKGLELTCRVPQGLHTAYRGDALRLRQVLVNLLGNAVKFTGRGEIDVRVMELAGAEPGHKMLRFEVQDTGIGIQPASLAAIFDSFSQADGSTTRRYGGTGLGLAISKQLVQLMGGQIDVQSTPGVGSTFGFAVSLRQEKRTDIEHQPESLNGRQVLVVDDNATNREILREQLQACGIRVTEAASGEDAMARLRSRANTEAAFDFAILDYKMPGMHGLDVVRAARADPVLRDLRVMLLSSMSHVEEDTDWRAQRVDACLTKPVRRKDLQSVLSRVLAEPQSETVMIRKLQPPTSGSNAPLGLKLLLIEDNPVNQAVACAMLELLGCEVTVASDGIEGASIFAGRQFDVVLMDCQMPKLDGYGATARIRAFEQQAGRVRTPVVALTANALEGDRVKCLQAGMDEFLTKPFTQEQLRLVLGACMAAATANDPRQQAASSRTA
jgi:CheY-like chemotaxis protein